MCPVWNISFPILWRIIHALSQFTDENQFCDFFLVANGNLFKSQCPHTICLIQQKYQPSLSVFKRGPIWNSHGVWGQNLGKSVKLINYLHKLWSIDFGCWSFTFSDQAFLRLIVFTANVCFHIGMHTKAAYIPSVAFWKQRIYTFSPENHR